MQHPVGGRVGDVENPRIVVEFHVAGDAERMAELNVGIAVDDGVGMVVVARVMILSKVVANQFAVVAIVVPIHVIIIMRNSCPIGRFMVHVDVATEQVVVLVLYGVVIEEEGQSVGPMKLFAAAWPQYVLAVS